MVSEHTAPWHRSPQRRDTTPPPTRRLRRRNVVRFWRRYRSRICAYQQGAITLAQLGATVQGWTGHLRHGSTTGLRKAVLRTPIPRREVAR